MIASRILAATLVVGITVAAPVVAQQAGRGGGGRGVVLAQPGAGFQVTESAPLEVTPIRNAPFSAEAVTEVTQTLGDGNRIERRYESSVARDSQGRIRREEQIALVGPLAATGATAPRLVTLTDPDSGFSYTLDDTNNVAYRSRAADNAKREELKKLAAKLEDVTRGELRGDGGRGDISGSGGAKAAKVAEAAVQPVTENLGFRTIEGIRAQGTRTTTTIPAGAIGNVLPISIVSERWFSPELQMPLLITRRDPRSGETVYRLMNILRSEPAGYLFMVPSNYEIRDGTLNFKVFKVLDLDLEKARKAKEAAADAQRRK
jgi:hypothetical protein